MKKWFIRIALILGTLVVIGAIAVFMSLNTIVKKGVERVGPIVTKTEVKLDSAILSPFSGKGELHGLFVGNPEGYKTPSAIKVGDIEVNIKLKSVLTDVILVQSIIIDAPEVSFEGGLTGSNIKELLDNISSVASADPEVPGEKPPEGGKKLKVESLLIKNTKVHVTLKGLGGKTTTVAIPDIYLTNIGVNEDGGVSSAELSRQVIKKILEGVLKELPKLIGNAGGSIKEIGTGAKEQTEKATRGIKSLFKR